MICSQCGSSLPEDGKPSHEQLIAEMEADIGKALNEVCEQIAGHHFPDAPVPVVKLKFPTSEKLLASAYEMLNANHPN